MITEICDSNKPRAWQNQFETGLKVEVSQHLYSAFLYLPYFYNFGIIFAVLSIYAFIINGRQLNWILAL